MKSPLRRLALLTLALFTAARGRAAPDPGAAFTVRELAQGYRESSLLAMPRAAHRATADSAETREGRRQLKKFSRFDDLRVLAPAPGETADQAVARLRATGRYEFVEPDYIRHADVTPSDSRFATQWSYANTGASNGVAGADISALSAWDVLHDAPSVIVAVIDSGAHLTHGDLTANLIAGISATSGRGTITNTNPADDFGHGTHVAGIIGAFGNNGSSGAGVTGVAWRVQLMPLKFLTSAGTGSLSDGIACIDYAISHGVHIINASYGESTGSFSNAEFAAIRRARDAGIIFVAAAGNDGVNLDVSPHYPASYPLDNILAVGNSDRRDTANASSNYGAAVELFAPGTEILSTYNTGDTASATLNGTSMAAPHVAGALALLKQKFPNDTPRQLINRLLRSVDTPASLAGKSQTNGRLNLARALASADNRPFNDDFAARAILTTDNIAARSSSAGGTRESGEPAPAGISGGGGSLWWQWTSAAGGSVTVSTTTSSTIDTVLAVYTGNSFNTFTPVASNDDAPGGTNSRVSFTAQPGVAYQIAVEGKNGASGFVQLAISTIPINDAFATPVDLTGASATVTATNLGGSRETGEPQILGNAGGASLWYRWTAPKNGRFQIAVTSFDLDPLLAVYTGSAVNALTLVASNDDIRADALDSSSLCTFNAVAGATYRFAVDAKNGTGQFTLTLNDSLWQAAATDSITTSPAIAPDGTVYVGSTDKSLYAFAPNGALKWTFPTGGSLDSASAAIGADGTIYVGSNDGKVYAVKPDGTQRWVQNLGATALASNSPAIAADGTVYLKAADGYVYALNGTDGSQRWRYNVNVSAPADPTHYGSPSIAADGTIYQGSNDNSLYAINPEGSKKWTFAPPTADGGIYSPPAIDAAGNLYFTTLNGAIYSLTGAGNLRWRFASGGNCTSSPALSSDGATLYYGGYDKKLYALASSDGAVRWTSLLGDEIRASSPAIDAAGVIYIGCYDKKIYAINPDGSLKRTWATSDFIRSSPAIDGTTLYVGSNDYKLYAFDLSTGPAGGPWPQYRANARRLGRTMTDAALAFTAQPAAQNIAVGYPLTLTAAGVGQTPLTYQWFKDGTAISGATRTTFTIDAVTSGDAGTYFVKISGPQGTLTSSPASIAVAAPNPGRLINLSVRTVAGTDAQTLIVGFALSGSPDKPLLIRGIGPSLTAFGVTGALSDSQLTLYNSNITQLDANDNWSGVPAISAAFGATGAFSIDGASRDAVILRTLGAGSYTAQVTGANNATGIALAELYDTAITTGARLVNVSARAQVNTGDGVLIAGFVISGNIPKQVLIRAIGPGLAPFGVGGVLADPQLQLFNSATTLVSSNDNWGGNSTLSAAFASVGAFALTNASKDAALLATLPPGNYTAQVSGVNSTTGVALIEVYEVP